MKINWLPPALVRYTDDLPETVGGNAFGPYVRIRPEYKDDLGIHEHEFAHVQVFWLTLGLSLVLGNFKRFRLWNEGRAYLVQTKYPDRHGEFMTIEDAALRMAMHARYKFEMSYAAALAYLTAMKER